MDLKLDQRALNIAATALVAVMTLGINGIGQKADESALTETFGRHLNIYLINLERKPKGFHNFDNFQIEELPKQDIHNPGVDSFGRSRVGGELRLVNGTLFTIKSAFLKMNKSRKYEWLTFETAEVGGESYKFSGHFLRKRVENRPSIDTYLRGTLIMEKKGKKVLSKNMPFTIFAIE